MVEAFVLLWMGTWSVTVSPPMDKPSCERLKAIVVARFTNNYPNNFHADNHVLCMPVKVPKGTQ